MVNRMGRTLGVLAAGLALAGGVAGCATSVSGSPVPAGNVPAPTTPAGGGSGGTGSTSPSTPPSGTSGDLAQQAQQTCAQLPKDSVTQAFGATGVSVTADSGTTRPGGIKQVSCLVTGDSNFRASVVVQIYPPATMKSPDQYYQIMQQQFGSVQRLNGISGADVAGLFQETDNGKLVDEAFAAKQDSASATVDILLVAVADSPGVQPKLVAFLTALAKD